MPRNPMHLLPAYKSQADPVFVRFYPHHFDSRTMGYVHWTAGWREETDKHAANSDHYHRVFLLRGGKAAIVDNCGGDVGVFLPSHTYARNARAFGFALAGMLDATTEDFGDEVPAPGQIRLLRDNLAKVCLNRRVPVGNLMSHQEAADNADYLNPFDPDAPHDPYGPMRGNCERWDLWCAIDPGTLDISPLEGRGEWARLLKSPEPDRQAFMDWLRGTVFLELQEASRRLWDPAHGRHG